MALTTEIVDYITNIIGEFIYEKCSGGISNEVFICDTKTKKYIIKIINNDYKKVVNILQKIQNTTIPKIIHYEEDRSIIIEEYIDGIVLENDDLLNDSTFYNILNAIDRFHTDLKHCESSNEISNDISFSNRLKRYYEELEYPPDSITKFYQISMNFLKENENEIITSHNDIHAFNIIQRDQSYWIIDPEFIGKNHYIYDFINLIEEASMYLSYEHIIELRTKVSKWLIDKYNIDIFTINIVRNMCNLFWLLWSFSKYKEDHDIKRLEYANKRYANFIS